MPKTILFADNHLDFLSTWTEYLELAGYRVYTANSPEEARTIILRGNIHLAIFDKRLVDDNDEKDISGIDLAKDPRLGFICSVILTDYPSHQNVRTVLRPGESSAVDFISKEDGPQEMLDALSRAFKLHIPIHWDLGIQWESQSGLSIPGILGMLDKNNPSDELIWRNEELDDLLRMVFFEFENVAILRKLWIDNGRVALLAHCHHEQADRYLAVTIGHLAPISSELVHIKAFPDDPGEGGTTHVGFYRRAHYAANAWRLSGADIEQLELLQETADNLKEAQLGAVLIKLFQNTLSAWRKQHEPVESVKSIQDLYRHYYGLFQLQKPEIVFRDRVVEISKQAKRFNLIHDLSIVDHNWHIQITPQKSFTFPDPCPLLFQPVYLASTLNYIQASPGSLRFNTIVVDAAQVTWLTDFSMVGEFPIWHDFAFVECELRFNFLDSSDLTELAEVENQLRPSWPKRPRSGVDTPAEMRKFVNCILRVREQAYSLIRHDPTQYALCLLFNALSDLLVLDQPVLRNRRDVAQLVHRLIFSGCICMDLLGEANEDANLNYPPLKFSDGDFVYRGDEVLNLTGTEFRILALLNDCGGKPCSRERICKAVFGIEHPNYNQLHGQIDANLNRLREKVEPDPKNPHYILTVHGRGVRLVVHPKADALSADAEVVYRGSP